MDGKAKNKRREMEIVPGFS